MASHHPVAYKYAHNFITQRDKRRGRRKTAKNGKTRKIRGREDDENDVTRPRFKVFTLLTPRGAVVVEGFEIQQGYQAPKNSRERGNLQAYPIVYNMYLGEHKVQLYTAMKQHEAEKVGGWVDM